MTFIQFVFADPNYRVATVSPFFFTTNRRLISFFLYRVYKLYKRPNESLSSESNPNSSINTIVVIGK